MKNCTPLWREARFEVKSVKKLTGSEHFLEVEMSKKCTPLWREAHFKVKMLERHMLGPLLKVQMWFCVAGARDYAPGSLWAMAGVGNLQRVCKDNFRVAIAIQATCSSEMLGGCGADFLRGVAFWSIRSLGLLRWLCVTGAALRMTWPHLFCGKRSTLHRWSGKIAKRNGTRPSALHSTFHF